jgi:hypothetical protein
MFSAIKSRLPGAQEVLLVYAVCVFFLFSWTTITFFWKLPAWLNYLTLGEITTTYFYTVFTEFLESLLYLLLTLMICAILPPVFLRDKFSVRGTLLVTALPAAILLVQYWIVFRELKVWQSTLLTVGIVGIIFALLIWLSDRFQAVATGIALFADRATTLLYIYVPLMLVSSIVVLFRMLVM